MNGCRVDIHSVDVLITLVNACLGQTMPILDIFAQTQQERV